MSIRKISRLSSNICCSSLQELFFDLKLLSSIGACKFRIIILHQPPFSITYKTLPLTYSTLWTANDSLMYKKSYPKLIIFTSFSIEESVLLHLSVSPLSHQNSCILTKSKLYFLILWLLSPMTFAFLLFILFQIICPSPRLCSLFYMLNS